MPTFFVFSVVFDIEVSSGEAAPLSLAEELSAAAADVVVDLSAGFPGTGAGL